MAKNTKVSTGNHGKQITAFFALANKSSRQQGSPNASSARLTLRGRADTQNGEGSSKLNPSNNHLSMNVANGSKGPDSAPMSPRRSERVKPVSLQPPAVISTLKRTREPETQLKVPNLGRARNADRRKSKFDSGSEDDTGGAVVYVTSPRQRKKARVSPPTEFSQPSNSDMVPSSQSNEEELVTANQVNGASTANRGGATKRSKLPTPHGDDEGVDAMMIVDQTSIFQDEVAEPLKPAFQITQMLTPPLSDLSSPPPTPVVSTKKSTQHIIASIKARAYAKSFSSPESDQYDFQDDLDSSDDEPLPTLPIHAPRQRNTRHKVKQTDNGPSGRATMRYSLRNCSSSPLETNAKTQARPAKKGPDPFTALLKEKHQAERRGNGSGAIEKAELTLLQYGGKDALLNEMEDDEDDEVLEWDTNIPSSSIRDILNARSVRKDDSDLDLDDGDRERILEEEGGKTVLKILEQDKAERFKTGSDDKVSGIQIWTHRVDEQSSAMAVDGNYRISGDSPVVSLLNNSLTCGATIRTSSLLKMNLMSVAQPAERVAIASCLLGIILSNSSLCTDATVNTLINFWSSFTQPSTSTILFNDILECLKGFGLDPHILAAQNWEIESPGACNHPQDKEVVIPRLVALITACARSGRLRIEEIPDISIAMMLIGMDAGTSPALQRDLAMVIDLLMRCLSPDDVRPRENEFACASRVLQMSGLYSPVNKLRLLSLLSNGSGPSRRIAEFVAYCMVTDKQSPTPSIYAYLPPLVEVLDQLQSYSSSSSKLPGIFALHEGTDYIDLGFFIAILGVAVSNVKGYVAQERQKAKSASLLESPSKTADKPKTDLQLLHGALETLHSKISDSRAAHLERSRTKAAVKQLAMNIYYQREFWLRHSRENKSITLAQYFRKKN